MSSIESSKILQHQLVEKKFVVGRQIGKGSFGDVYEATDIFTGKRVAIKFEDRKSSHSQLKNEYRVWDSMLCHCIALCFLLLLLLLFL